MASPTAIAHRGGANERPENSLAAFDHAVSLGIACLETDVHVSADGAVVAFHDADLGRVTDRSGRIDERTLDEIREVDLGGSSIPTLRELLERYPDARFNVDAKSDEVVLPLLGVIDEFGAHGRVCIGSFSDRRLQRIRSIRPRVATSSGPRQILRGVLRAVGLPLPRPTGTVAHQVPKWLLLSPIGRRFVLRSHRDGLVVHAWTVDEPEEMRRLLALGVDGIMTDSPTLLLEELEHFASSEA